uniref:Uncharacterized protein n=1 Tax=Anguilla anguilla TaxID=7936 RepID=A0A0E9S2A3_ANGAN
MLQELLSICKCYVKLDIHPSVLCFHIWIWMETVNPIAIIESNLD